MTPLALTIRRCLTRSILVLNQIDTVPQATPISLARARSSHSRSHWGMRAALPTPPTRTGRFLWPVVSLHRIQSIPPPITTQAPTSENLVRKREMCMREKAMAEKLSLEPLQLPPPLGYRGLWEAQMREMLRSKVLRLVRLHMAMGPQPL